MLTKFLRAAAGRVQPVAPTDPNFSSVSLLLHGDGTNGAQNNTFLDSSTNNFTVTRFGNTTQGSFSPFTSTPYSTSVNGGSLYFDGAGDYVTVPSNAAFAYGSGNFTIEFWLYLNVNNVKQIIYDNRPGTSYLAVAPVIEVRAGGGVVYYVNGGDRITGATLQIGTWYHIAISRSSSVTKLFVNGVQSGSSYTDTNSYISGPVRLGCNNETQEFLNGYMSNVRVVKGTAVYTANFTPPTAPLTAITNTSLLLSGTNAGIFDSTGKNNLETVNGAQVSTSVVKYGTGSMYFGGTNDYVMSKDDEGYWFSNDFTVEAWVYIAGATRSIQPIVNQRSSGGSGTQLNITYNGTYQMWAWIDGTHIFTYTSGSVIPANQWVHLAWTREGSTFRTFINGVLNQVSTHTLIPVNQTVPFTVGGDAAGFNQFFTGYIDDLRITKGIARYTANFTPPTAAFPNS